MQNLKRDVERLLRAVYGDSEFPDADTGGLVADIARLNSSVRILASSNSQLNDQMADVVLTLKRQDDLIDKSAVMLGSIRASMDANTEMTRDIRDAIVTARTTGRVARWLAPTIVAGAAVVASLKGWAVDVMDFLRR